MTHLSLKSAMLLVTVACVAPSIGNAQTPLPNPPPAQGQLQDIADKTEQKQADLDRLNRDRNGANPTPAPAPAAPAAPAAEPSAWDRFCNWLNSCFEDSPEERRAAREEFERELERRVEERRAAEAAKQKTATPAEAPKSQPKTSTVAPKSQKVSKAVIIKERRSAEQAIQAERQYAQQRAIATAIIGIGLGIAMNGAMRSHGGGHATHHRSHGHGGMAHGARTSHRY